MHRFRHLAAALAQRSQDDELVRHAAMICRLGTIEEVRFVHVLSRGTGGGASAHGAAEQQLRQRAAAQFAAASSLRVAYDVLSGPLTDQLLAYTAQQQIDLLLVGGGSSRRTLARRLAMKAPCSVWMVPQGAFPSLSKILVPIDFSDHAADTIKVACSMARLCEAAEAVCPEVVALHVYFNEAIVTYEDYDAVLRGQEAEAYEKFMAPLNCQGVRVRPRFEESANVPHAIARAAKEEDADLIVMGTRGRSRSAAILLGSATDAMLTDTTVPLLAIKHYGARMSVLQALLDRRFLFAGGMHT
jgi:nucleotide-binding universal stress UspA family protein